MTNIHLFTIVKCNGRGCQGRLDLGCQIKDEIRRTKIKQIQCTLLTKQVCAISLYLLKVALWHIDL